VAFFLKEKVPLFDGKPPDARYLLDDEAQQKLLGFSHNSFLKIADEYDHYPGCKHAVIEHKSKNLRDSVKQLEATTKELVKAHKNVDVTVIVAEKISHTESKIYKKTKDHRLYDKRRGAFFQIRAGNHFVDILVYYTVEVSKMWEEYSRRLDRWAST